MEGSACDRRRSEGLTCKQCGSHSFRVTNTKLKGGVISRLRRCKKCGCQKQTIERDAV